MTRRANKDDLNQAGKLLHGEEFVSVEACYHNDEKREKHESFQRRLIYHRTLQQVESAEAPEQGLNQLRETFLTGLGNIQF